MKIAACLIVKNSEATIGRCLDSIRPFVDGVFVYDTGSTDGTLELLAELEQKSTPLVCNRCGHQMTVADRREPCDCEDNEWLEIPLAPITVEQGEWRDDFAWAREQSFAMPDEDFDWMVWLDDDDVIAGAQWLRQLAATAHPTVDGFVFQYDYARDENGTCVCVLWRERLLRRASGFTWKGAVHEVATIDGRMPNFVMVPPEQVRYVHERPADRYPPTRNLEILEREAAKQTEEKDGPDPRTLAYLGTELMSQERFAEAVGYLEGYLGHPEAAWSDERMQVHHKLAACMRVLGNPMAALEVEHAAFKERKNWSETYAGMAESYAMLGRWGEVEWAAGEVLRFGMPPSMLILNPLEFTFLPLVRLSEACQNTGRAAEAIAWLEKAAQVAPGHPHLLAQHGALERMRLENDLVAQILAVREQLVRHDENLKALNVMENVPYLIANRPEIVKARADQREMCKHYLHPEEYARWYIEEDKESTLTDEHIDLVADAFGRVKGLLEGLAEQQEALGRPPVVLDLGCNDWWMGEALARAGYHCDGVELNRQSFEAAIARRDRFERDATIVHGDLHDANALLFPLPQHDDGEAGYDAVSLFEVIEHVPDIEATLAVCESLLKPGGRLYISTPDGAFELGNLPHWAHVERKGHLRAIPMQELAETLNARGSIERLEQTDGDRVAFAAYTPKTKLGRITFYLGGSWEPWTPISVIDGGIGGSETAAVRLSSCLARMGYEVTVHAECEPSISAGGVIWKHYSSFDPTGDPDLLVVSRLPHVFDNPIGAKRAALWCHDNGYDEAFTEARVERMTDVVCLSDWERDRYARLYPQIADKLRVIRNGITWIDPATSETMFPDGGRSFAERKPRCVFSSSADRGLDVMLECWPKIREAVPDAELHVFYGFQTLERIALVRPELLTYKAKVLGLAEAAGGEEGGIFLRGRIGQRDLAAELSEARVWSYPTAFLETSCIGAMEARAAGAVPVTSDLAALRESVGLHGIMLPWSADEDEPANAGELYKASFVKTVVQLLTDEDDWTGWHRRARAGVEELDWSERAKDWAALVNGFAAGGTVKDKKRRLVAA